MRTWILFFAVFFGISCVKAEEVYYFQPDWEFIFSGSRYPPLIYPGAKPSSAHFESFEILKSLENGKGWSAGIVERPDSIWEATTLTYILEAPSIGRAKAVARFLSMGMLMPCMREFDVYDSNDQPIGYIGGEYYTDQALKMVCYNRDGELRAIATLDEEWDTLTVVDAKDEDRVIATAEKVFAITWKQNIYYFWKVTIDDEDKILDPRLLWPMITFIADYYWEPKTTLILPRDSEL